MENHLAIMDHIGHGFSPEVYKGNHCHLRIEASPGILAEGYFVFQRLLASVNRDKALAGGDCHRNALYFLDGFRGGIRVVIEVGNGGNAEAQAFGDAQ